MKIGRDFTRAAAPGIARLLVAPFSEVFENSEVVDEDYMQQTFGQILWATRFTIDKFADVFKDSGATYFVKLPIRLLGPRGKLGQVHFGSEMGILVSGTAGGTDISTPATP